jgi:hypothetical protein
MVLDRNFVIIIASAFSALIVVVGILTAALLVLVPTSVPAAGAAPPPGTPAAPAVPIWQVIIVPTATVIAAFVAFIGVLITAIITYRNLISQLRITTRNSFLDMLIGNDSYRNDLDSFMHGVLNKDYDFLSARLDRLSGLFYLFILKPGIRNQIRDAIAKKDDNRIDELTERLFTT